jgi:hypothetical protein
MTPAAVHGDMTATRSPLICFNDRNSCCILFSQTINQVLQSSGGLMIALLIILDALTFNLLRLFLNTAQ